MPFKKMEKSKLPPRHWVLVGYPGSGKSTFSTQMRLPLLPIDADHRFEEVVHLAQGNVYELSSNPADSVDPEKVYELLNQNMPGSDVATIIVDSLTTIITPKVVQAVMDNDAGRSRNRMAAWKDKAMSMRLLQDAVTRWGTDVLWIYHLQDSRDEQAREVTKATLSATERARLYRSINLELHIIQEPIQGARKARRGVKVVWARRGKAGMTIWDDSDHWVGMPEKIEQAVYGGLTIQEQDKIEQEAPAVFATEEAAIEWAQGQSVFNDFNHCKNSWNKLKREKPGLSLAEWGLLWVEKVEAMVEKAASETKVQAESAQPAAPTQDGEEPLEERFDFTLFCDNLVNKIPFFRLAGDEAVKEIAQTIAELGMVYDPDKEEALSTLLEIHIESLPTFKSLSDFLYQLHLDFKLEEQEAKALLKKLGFSGFPNNGDALEKSRRMYAAVKRAKAPAASQAEIPFD